MFYVGILAWSQPSDSVSTDLFFQVSFEVEDPDQIEATLVLNRTRLVHSVYDRAN